MWSASFLLVVATVFLAMAIIYGGRWSATYYFSYADELYALKLSINNSLANPIRVYDLRHFLTLCNDPQSGVAYAYYVQGAGQLLKLGLSRAVGVTSAGGCAGAVVTPYFGIFSYTQR